MAKVVFLPPAAKYLKKIKDKKLKVLYHEAVKNIAENPVIGSKKTEIGVISHILKCREDCV